MTNNLKLNWFSKFIAMFLAVTAIFTFGIPANAAVKKVVKVVEPPFDISQYTKSTFGTTATVNIPSIGVSVPLIYSKARDVQTKDWTCLGKKCPMRYLLNFGVLHIFGTANPGDLGNSIIVGHSSAYKSEPGNYKTVFARLRDIPLGSKFNITYSDGRVQTFEVFENFNFKFQRAQSKKPKAEDIAASNKRNNRYPNQRVVTLETCWPKNSTSERWIVQGKLVDEKLPETQNQ